MDDNEKVLNKIPVIAAIVLGVITILMIFVPNITAVVEGKTVSFSGLNIVFGVGGNNEYEYTKPLFGSYDAVTITYTLHYFHRSPAGIAYCLALISTLFVALTLRLNNGIISKIYMVIACLCFGGAAVLFFLTNSMVVVDSVAPNVAESESIFKESLKLSIGAICGGIFCTLSCISTFAALFIKKEQVKGIEQ